MTLATLLLAFLPLLSAQPDRFSIPACSGPGRELAARSTFLICYDSSLRVPVWTGYELTGERIHGTAKRPHGFRHDYGLSGVSAYDSDYRNSGYSRGHMVPAADFAWSDDAIRATFLLSNAVPQLQSVNQGAWFQIEAAVRRIAAVSDAVYVFTGVLFEDETQRHIGARQVAVPSHTYKVMLAIKGDEKTMYAAIVPNAGARGDFTASVDEVECRTGFDFFSALPDGEQSLLQSERRMLPGKK